MQTRRHGFNPWVRKIPWRRKWQPIPVSLSGKSHGQRSLAGYSPRGHNESDMTQWLNTNIETSSLKIFICKNQLFNSLPSEVTLSVIGRRTWRTRGQFKKWEEGVPQWFDGKESTSNAAYTALIPWPRKIPHVAGQLRPWTPTLEPWH